MSTVKLVSDASANGDSGIAGAIAAIQTVRQELRHQLENLTTDCEALVRAEKLVLGHQFPPSCGSSPRDCDTAGTMSRDTTGASAFPNGLRSAIRELGASLPSRFTAAEVLVRLQTRGFKFTGNPAAAVRDGLYALCHEKSPRFRVSEAGKVGEAESIRMSLTDVRKTGPC